MPPPPLRVRFAPRRTLPLFVLVMYAHEHFLRHTQLYTSPAPGTVPATTAPALGAHAVASTDAAVPTGAMA